jgi:acyl carrier protein
MDDEIRGILATYGRLSVPAGSLADHADLQRAGLTSHASVSVMLALEDAFEVEFPESMLRKSTFESISAIRNALETLLSVGQTS